METIGKVRQLLPVAVVVISFVLLSVFAQGFFSFDNLANVLQVASFVAVPAMGLSVVMIAGMFDLSFVGVIGVTSVLNVLLTYISLWPGISLIMTLAVAVILQVVNALLIVRFRIHPWLATIATMLMYLGLEQALSGGNYVHPSGQMYDALRFSSFLGAKGAVWITIAVWVVVVIAIQNTPFGRYLYAIGGSPQEGRRTGINTDGYKFMAFVTMGILCWITSILYVGQLSGYPPEAAYTDQLDVILAVFFGMALSRRSIVNIVGAVVGSFFVAFLDDGLGYLGVSSYWVTLLEGVLIVLVVMSESLRRHELVHLE